MIIIPDNFIRLLIREKICWFIFLSNTSITASPPFYYIKNKYSNKRLTIQCVRKLGIL